jgi:hypothetical protein
MEEKKYFDNLKLDQLRADIQAGIASEDAGALDADESSGVAALGTLTPSAKPSGGTKRSWKTPSIRRA